MKPPEHGGVRLHCDIHILQDGTATGLCACLCVNPFKSIMWLCVCTVYTHRLTSTVPRLLSSLCLPFCSFLLFVAPSSDYISLFSSHFCFYLSPAAFPFICASIHPSSSSSLFVPLSLSSSSSPVHQTHSHPAAPEPAEPAATRAQADG